MENNAGAVRIKALFTDIFTHGISNYSVKDVRSDIKVCDRIVLIHSKISFPNSKIISTNNIYFQRLRIDLSLIIPRVEVRGKYDISGQVLVLPVRSNGEFWAEFSKLTTNK